jgi:hypothetical protein
MPRRGRVAWLAAGALLTVLAVTVGPATAGLWLARQSETRHETYALAGGELTVEFSGVDVRVAPGTAGEVTVEHTLTWSYAKPTHTEQWDGQILRISAGCRRIPIGPPCDTDYTLRVPADVHLTIRGGSGDVIVDRLRSAAAHIQTTSGDIDITVAPGTTYRLQITSTEQRVDIPHDAGASSTIIAHSDRGSVRIR